VAAVASGAPVRAPARAGRSYAGACGIVRLPDEASAASPLARRRRLELCELLLVTLETVDKEPDGGVHLRVQQLEPSGERLVALPRRGKLRHGRVDGGGADVLRDSAAQRDGRVHGRLIAGGRGRHERFSGR
jgi:hypothetical protein